MLDIKTLPDDREALKQLLVDKDRHIEHLKFIIAKLRRFRFGESSEGLEAAGQIPMNLEELLGELAEIEASPAAAAETEAVKDTPARRRGFPEHFEVRDNRIPPEECTCPDCGGELKLLGKDGNPDVAEVVEVKTITFTVTRHIRPKRRCTRCARIVQAPAPPRPIPRSFAGSSLLAMVLAWKYCFHLPLYRQCQFFAHAGFTISRTTLMQWVGASSALLGPLAEALGRYVLSARNLNADDTPVKVLAPGNGKTKKGRLWTYVRDGTRWGSTDPPAVWYRYSPSWHGKYPQKHLKSFSGTLQVDGYAGFEPLFVPPGPNLPARVREISCMAHARRKFFDIYAVNKSAVALAAMERMGELYKLETLIRGRSPEERCAERRKHAVPLLDDLHRWMKQTLEQVERNSEIAEALRYSLKRWETLCRYTEDGHVEIDNNIAERSIRGIGVGKRNYLFFGSDNGGERAAIIYALIETCKLNKIDAERYLAYVLERIGEHPINRIDELLPWNVADKLAQPDAVTQALAA